ncbi:glycosyltransferase family 4 protein [Ferdinandcohnia sp. SAFN-114]|uniref:glycosyltransferase family 4 protein n=1 Tax=Ferdinandcohnia sp. SAFN-114 TaxID=3387275 RepID=UPI003F7E16B2
MGKRILMISQNFYPEIGSAGNRMKNIYTLLKKNGYDVNVLTTDPTYPNNKIYEDEEFWDDEFLNKHADDLYRVKLRNRKYSRSIMNRLLFYLEIAVKMVIYVLFNRNKYDVVIATSPAIFIAMVGLLAKYRFKSKLVLEIRDLWPESLKGVGVFSHPLVISTFSMIETLLYKKADKIVVNSEGFVDYISKKAHIPTANIAFLPNGAREFEINIPKEKNEKFSVIYAGNMGLAQDSNILMDLASELAVHDINLTVISYGLKREQFVHYVKDNQLTNVHFIKPTTRSQCLNIMAKHHVGIVTLTNQEVFETVLPGKVIDYMTCQVPIVASVSGTSRKIIEREQIGYVSSSKNAKEMLKDILKIKANPNEQRKFENNGKKYVNNYFLWENNINTLIDILENRVSKSVILKKNVKEIITMDKVESL